MLFLLPSNSQQILKILIVLVAPGVELVRAILRVTRLLIVEDFPTFDLPMKHISGTSSLSALPDAPMLLTNSALMIFATVS